MTSFHDSEIYNAQGGMENCIPKKQAADVTAEAEGLQCVPRHEQNVKFYAGSEVASHSGLEVVSPHLQGNSPDAYSDYISREPSPCQRDGVQNEEHALITEEPVPKPQRRYCGLPCWLLLILSVLATAIVAAAVMGGVLGTRNRGERSEARYVCVTGIGTCARLTILPN